MWTFCVGIPCRVFRAAQAVTCSKRSVRNIQPFTIGERSAAEWFSALLLLNRISLPSASDVSAKLLIYQAFIEDDPGFPKHLARRVHDLCFQPIHEEFQPRTIWSLSNAFTSGRLPFHPLLVRSAG